MCQSVFRAVKRGEPGRVAASMRRHIDHIQKCSDGSCPLGPWITPASEIPDPQKLAMKLWVNDELMQDSAGQPAMDAHAGRSMTP